MFFFFFANLPKKAMLNSFVLKLQNFESMITVMLQTL